MSRFWRATLRPLPPVARGPSKFESTKGRGSVPEGLSSTEVGKAISEHAKDASEGEEGAAETGHDWLASVLEAVLLSIVAVLAAWSDSRRRNGARSHRSSWRRPRRCEPKRIGSI